MQSGSSGAAVLAAASCGEQTGQELLHEILPGLVAPSSSDSALTAGVTLGDELSRAHSEADVDLPLFKKIGSSLARIHTLMLNTDEERAASLKVTLNDSRCRDRVVNSMFIEPYVKKQGNNAEEYTANAYNIHDNQAISDAIQQLKNIFENDESCLIHGQFSTSATLPQENQPKVANCMSWCLGPGSFDLGVFLAHCILAHYQHILTPEDNDSHRTVAYAMLTACTHTADSYIKEIHSLDKSKDDLSDSGFISQAAGFTGAELIRCVLSPQQPASLQLRPEAKPDVLQSGIRLLTAFHRITSVGQLLNIALMLTL